MNENVTHRLVGYDKTTGEVRIEYVVPPLHLPTLKL